MVNYDINKGIEVAIGKYIEFIDSNDWFQTSMISTIYNLAVEQNAYIVQSDFIKVYNDNTTLQVIQKI